MIYLLLFSINIIYVFATAPYAKEPYQMMIGVMYNLMMNVCLIMGYFWLTYQRLM